jgi:two-component system response regulator AtoC
MDHRTIFVLDDDETIQNFLFNFLSIRGYRVTCFGSGEALLLRLASEPAPGLILLDVVMPDCDGVEVLQKVQALAMQVPILMLSGISNVRTVVESMKLGAMDFLMKPFDEEALERLLDLVFAQENTTPAARPGSRDAKYGHEFLTNNPNVLRQAEIVARVAYTDVPILILGESGVGKEVMARFAHRHSGRKDKPFIKINCAALPHELLESELFGYERGAFTGAMNDKVGKFGQADGGTLLLDEIGEMSPHLQSKMLHVLQDGTFSRLGGTKTIHVDVRIIAATNIKLESAIANGTFREDLLYRLNVIRVDLSPLRERIDDIPRLCKHFVEIYREKYHSNVEIPNSLMRAFAAYSWPGNIRQLENTVKRFLLLGDAEQIEKELCPVTNVIPIRPPTMIEPVPESLLSVGAAAADFAERQLVLKTLEETGGNRKKAAQRLNICYKALLNKLKKWKVNGHFAAKAMSAISNGTETVQDLSSLD